MGGMRRTKFQSSPVLMDGRNKMAEERLAQVAKVSILARPDGRAQLFQVLLADGDGDVSILARPDGRAQPAVAVAWIEALDRFQSSPVLMDGRNPPPSTPRSASGRCFNPRPS